MLITHTRPNSGCDYHRVQLPLAHMSVAPKVPTLFVNRDTHWSGQTIREFKADGGRFIYDLDDSIELPDGHPLQAHYAKPALKARQADLLALADIVTVTTVRLAEEFRHKTTAPIEILPNALPFDRDQFTRNTRDDDRPIIWAGGSSHEVDLALVREAVDGRHFTLAGYQRIPPWFNMVQMFPGCLVKPAVPVSDYMRLYDGHRIAVAPLATSPFAECKSNLKILEAGAKGLPIVCSRTLPYYTGDMKRAGGVQFADTADGWRRKLGILMADPLICRELGEQLAAHVRTHYHLDAVNVHRRQILEG